MFAATRSSIATPLRRLNAPCALVARCNSTRFYSSTMHENDPEVLGREKDKNLRRTKNDKSANVHEHAPGWNEMLASTSEANVKADKAGGDPATLQSTTVEFMRSKKQESEGETSTTAHYSRDEVSGPLRSADSNKEKVIVQKGRVVVDAEGPDVVAEALKAHEIRTPSEERVKADRNEI